MSEWISVKDKLPEVGECVLVTDGFQYSLSFISSVNNRFTQVNTLSQDFHKIITHWMPLPEPPK